MANRGECCVSGCGRQSAARAMCKMHWARWRKHGDPNIGGKNLLSGSCSVGGCNASSCGRFRGGDEFCNRHYLQMFNHGRILPDKEPSKGGMCEVAGCVNPVKSKFSPHCWAHYYRMRRSGSVGVAPVKVRTAEGKDAAEAVHGKTFCQYCGEETDRLKFCDNRCCARYVRSNPKDRLCAMCGEPFAAAKRGSGRDRLVCSDACHKARDAKWAKEFLASENGREWVRRNSYIRRSRVAGAFVEKVSWGKVMRLASWKCYICGEEIPRGEKWPSPSFGTVDHVIPLSKGGDHSYANCKAAHLVCNLRKGATMPS